MSTQKSDYLLQMFNISKAFPGVHALEDVTLQVRPGEIHGLVGENGAGKSTLMKILSGAYVKDGGRILLEDQEVHISNPHAALQLGIVTIYQECNLATELTVAENIFMGRLPCIGKIWVNRNKLHEKVRDLLKQLDANFTSRTLIRDLSAAQRQMVEIVKALSISARIIVLDEPTASLTGQEVNSLFEMMRRLRNRGVSIIFITHRLREVLSVADRVTVLRDGHWISTDRVEDITEDKIVLNMVGRDLKSLFTKQTTKIGSPLLMVRELSGQGFERVSFTLHSGEIVGLFGLVGSGRTEVVRTIFGAAPIAGGTIELTGVLVHPSSPRDAIQSGLALAPEDRKAEGLVLVMSTRQNISLPNLRSLTSLGLVRRGDEKKLANKYAKALDIRCPTIETPTLSLSGGNQQKVVMAKWLSLTPKVLILDEPTRGIDVAGKADVHRLMSNLAMRGVGILMVSSELPEILSMSDRIIVMREGQFVATIKREEASEELIMSYAAGQAKSPTEA